MYFAIHLTFSHYKYIKYFGTVLWCYCNHYFQICMYVSRIYIFDMISNVYISTYKSSYIYIYMYVFDTDYSEKKFHFIYLHL